MNREEWLLEMTNRVRPLLKQAGAVVPDTVHVSVGFPSKGGLSMRRRTVGQCWKAECSADKAAQVFISPLVGDGTEAAAILVHELIHAAHPEAGHKGAFKRSAVAVGLEGKMTETTANAGLTARLNDIISQVGEYPHPKLSPLALKTKKQGTRLLKASCDGCGYTVRVTAKWLEIGAPICPTCEVAMDAGAENEPKDDDEE